MSRIYLSAPDIRGDERAMVDAAIASNWIAPIGPDLDAFEKEIAAATGVTRAVGLSSGTAALHLALIADGVGAGDIVLVSSFSSSPPPTLWCIPGRPSVFVVPP